MATRDDVRNWLVANVGARYVTYDSNGKSIGAQCVGLINACTDWLGYPRIPGLYAYELFDNAKQFSEYEVIPNSATFVPQIGDFLVYAAGSFGSSVGHVEIAGDNSTLNVVDALAQNYLNASATKGSPAAWVKHGYATFIGVIRPRLAQPVQQSPVNKGGNMAAVVDDSIKSQLRIVNSEVKGWDRAEVHSGKFDDREINAWRGQTVQKFLQQAWDEGKGYRDLKDKWKAAYDAQPGLLKQIDSLKAQLADAKKQTASSAPTDAETKLKSIRDALGIK